jgi:hypothetical protein
MELLNVTIICYKEAGKFTSNVQATFRMFSQYDLSAGDLLFPGKKPHCFLLIATTPQHREI